MQLEDSLEGPRKSRLEQAAEDISAEGLMGGHQLSKALDELSDRELEELGYVPKQKEDLFDSSYLSRDF
ncbi:MAG: hypothetical protein Q7R96_02070 [Nanoarchaeota archaeon]|nr:hypothetical protein [Nanoarchaeota archaeon]